MRTARTISVSLEAFFLGRLDRISRRVGSRSEAIRHLLRADAEREAREEMERSYRGYFARPGAARRERKVTVEMLSLAAWPAAGPVRSRRKGGRRGSPR